MNVHHLHNQWQSPKGLPAPRNSPSSPPTQPDTWGLPEAPQTPGTRTVLTARQRFPPGIDGLHTVPAGLEVSPRPALQGRGVSRGWSVHVRRLRSAVTCVLWWGGCKTLTIFTSSETWPPRHRPALTWLANGADKALTPQGL